MHPTQIPKPLHTKGWVYEEKIDDWRMVALKDQGRVRLVSRNARDHTKRFRDLVAALTALKPDTFTLDGEGAVFDQDLVSRFEWLRHLNHGDLATPPCSWCPGSPVEPERVRCVGGGAPPRVGGLRRKGPESKYTGGRSLKWLKVKQRDYRVKERGWDSRNKS